MLAIPIPERQLDALHRLLGHLCSAGDIAALVSLPLAGTLALGGEGNAPGVLSLADEAARFLQRRATNADLDARPQPYLVGFCPPLGRSTCSSMLPCSLVITAHRNISGGRQVLLVWRILSRSTVPC